MIATERFAQCGTMAPQAVVIVVEQSSCLTPLLQKIGDCLGFATERLAPRDDLSEALCRLRPMGVVFGSGCRGGALLLAAVARFDSGLPVLLVADYDPAPQLQGRPADHGCSTVLHTDRRPSPGEIMEFVFLASRTSGALALLPV
jgi:hypothetical protein